MNISDIAKLAGVSQATVSRYLNNGYVSKEKKEIIKKVIEETGYTPLAAAQNLRTQKTGVIGVIVPKISSESVSRMVDGITAELEGTGYNIFLANTNNKTDKELEYLELFRNNFADGVILSATDLTSKHRAILKNYPKPVVIMSQFMENMPCVYNDDAGAAQAIVTHLIEQGCSRIACLGVFEEDKAAGSGRHHGYEKALTEYGLTPDENLYRQVDFDVTSGYTAMQSLIDDGVDFDGVFCATDNIAIGVINCLHFNKKSVPQDILVAGIGDSLVSKAFIPSLTTAHFFYRTSGEEAAAMMLRMLSSRHEIPRQLCLGYEICERQSTLPDIASI